MLKVTYDLELWSWEPFSYFASFFTGDVINGRVSALVGYRLIIIVLQ